MKAEEGLGGLIQRLNETYSSEEKFIVASKSAHRFLAQASLDPNTSLEERLEIAILANPLERLLIEHYEKRDPVTGQTPKEALDSMKQELKSLSDEVKKLENDSKETEEKIKNVI